ncbi:hypothetical protein [Actinophytocola sp.]|uniref:hypothetical protein n=1 Tax=Actinophytocola sp. TaxID=1872138 RepID=UPI003D6B00FC
MSSHRLVVWLCAAAYVIALAAANLLTSTFELVPAGFGLSVTAGTYTAGLVLALRDTLHDLAGARVVLAALAAGADRTRSDREHGGGEADHGVDSPVVPGPMLVMRHLSGTSVI